MTSPGRKRVLLIMIIAMAVGMGWTIAQRISEGKKSATSPREVLPVPVETSAVTTGPITRKRTFSGTLEADARFVVAPKVSGRLKRLDADIADVITQGQVVCELDNDEYIQEVAQAKADLAVAKANLMEAQNSLIIANRELERIKTLQNRGITSDAQLDTATTNQLEKQARLEVAKAQVVRAEAALESANIRLGYTKVTALWSGTDTSRVVAERFVDEGDTVSANTPLLSVVKPDPLLGIIYITEKDYARLSIGQEADLTTDAFPDSIFHGTISRIAPIFKQETRQARVEITIDNPSHQLKPGMFIRATVTLDHRENAIIIPEQALTKRDGQTGVFVVDEEKNTALWRQVTPGILEDDRVSVTGIEPVGRVVTLGQQLLNDGTKLTIADNGHSLN